MPGAETVREVARRLDRLENECSRINSAMDNGRFIRRDTFEAMMHGYRADTARLEEAVETLQRDQVDRMRFLQRTALSAVIGVIVNIAIMAVVFWVSRGAP